MLPGFQAAIPLRVAPGQDCADHPVRTARGGAHPHGFERKPTTGSTSNSALGPSRSCLRAHRGRLRPCFDRLAWCLGDSDGEGQQV
jgi:hypothetical protein